MVIGRKRTQSPDEKKPQASFSTCGPFVKFDFASTSGMIAVLPGRESHFLDQNFEKFVFIPMREPRGFLAQGNDRDKFRGKRADA